MILGDHALPSARRTDGQLGRYVLSEYRERDSCWFSFGCEKRMHAARGDETAAAAPAAPAMDRAVRPQADRCCPVLGAISENRLTKGFAPRGGIAGEP